MARRAAPARAGAAARVTPPAPARPSSPRTSPRARVGTTCSAAGDCAAAPLLPAAGWPTTPVSAVAEAALLARMVIAVGTDGLPLVASMMFLEETYVNNACPFNNI